MKPSALLLLVSLLAATAAAKPPLFPQPLHLTRVIERSGGEPAIVEEYYLGDRAVSVSADGERTVIADYGSQRLIEIDRGRREFSVTPFARLAAALPKRAGAASLARPAWKSEVLAPREVSGRLGDAMRVRTESGDLTVEVVVDRELALEDEALAVIVGGSWPQQPSRETDAVVEAATPRGRVASSATSHGLPIEVKIETVVDGERRLTTSRVTAVRRETPPERALSLPAGWAQVESPRLRLAAELRAADEGPGVHGE